MIKFFRLLIISLFVGLGGLTSALAQTSASPSLGGPPSDRAQPRDPGTTGSTCPGPTLSDHLSRCDGVIRPPSGLNPDNTIEPPDTGTTPVIPPPGSPGGDQQIDPK